MMNEEKIQGDLVARFGFLDGKIRVARPRRIFADVPYDSFRAVLEHVCREMKFDFLCTITGQDENDVISIMYHTARRDGVVLSVKTTMPKSNPVHKTLTDVYPAALMYERELVDMFGVKVEGLPPGKRYPLPDGWPAEQYPLRKDWKTEMLGDFEVKKEG